MTFATSIVSCSSHGVGSGDMWNLYSGTHPDLHDNYMDPPDRIMIHADSGDCIPHCDSSKDKEAFNVFYGTQSIVTNPYTTSAIMEMERTCAISHKEHYCSLRTSKKQTDVNGNQEMNAIAKCFLEVPTTKTYANKTGLRRNKSDSDISDLNESSHEEKSYGRARILSDSAQHPSRRCSCRCTCGLGRDNHVGDKHLSAHAKRGKYPPAESIKIKQKSRSLKTLLHSILS